MLSLASRVNRWSDLRRVRRAFALPLVALVGLLLRTTSATTQPARLRDAAAALESRSPAVASAGALLHPPAVVLESHRRDLPATTHALAANTAGAVRASRAAIALAADGHRRRASETAFGYDATAPPFRRA
jgi:hypothetical protein